MNFKQLITLIAIPLIAACADEKGPADAPVVSVGNSTLTVSQLCQAMPLYRTPEDSARFAADVIRRWVRQEVMLQKAALNLTEEERDISAAIEEYRRALIAERYQQKLISQKFNPTISEQEIKEYYELMKENFRLENTLVKGIVAVVPKNTKELRKFRKALRFTEDTDYTFVEQFIVDNATASENSIDKWIPLTSLKRVLPESRQKSPLNIVPQKTLEFYDANNITFLLVTEICNAGAYAPVEYVSDKITNILVNKKKLDFVRSIESELYEEAMANNKIKYYN